MLWLKRLAVEGFGPFADEEVLEFPSEAGVTVVYGENMRGKTSLTNAIRYAFLGTAVGRGSRLLKVHTITNREHAAAGKYGFTVSLAFNFDGDDYELVRECMPTVSRPVSDEDYSQDVLLRRGTELVGPQESERLLQQVFPKEIARFFLFDGELLQEYEELLVNESDAGHRISGAIERILGVPILKRGRAHLRQLADAADREAAREASRQQKTQALGTALAQATEIKEEHQKEQSRLREQLDTLNSERSEIEQYLQTRQKYASLLQELDAAETRLKEIADEKELRRGELQAAMADAWRSLLRERVRSARENARLDVQKEFESLGLSLRAKAIENRFCGTCDRPIDDPTLKRLRVSLPFRVEDGADFESESMMRMSDLTRFRDADNAGEVTQICRQLTRLEFEAVDLNDHVLELRSELRESDPEAIRRHKVSYSENSERIHAVKAAIQGADKKLEEQEQNIQRLKRKIEETGSTLLKVSQFRSRTLTNAAQVFESAVETYKSQLRSRVEKTASELFMLMTTEKEDYAGLTINEGYGLTIRHRDGRAEEARSAGAEHVVALALMGALQRNAPLKGPIVMDSPFGRLDEEHTGNVVKALPQMAEQAVLLVYESEVRKSRMRNLLGSRLLREYELERISARKTRITEVE